MPFDGKLHVFQRYFIARNRLEQNSKQDKMAYEAFTTGASDPLNDKLLHICEGSLVSRKDVAAWFEMLAREYGVVFWKIERTAGISLTSQRRWNCEVSRGKTRTAAASSLKLPRALRRCRRR